MRITYIALTLLAVLSACTTTDDADIADGAPPQPISAEQVADASLRADPILAVGNKSPYTVNGKSYEILKDYRSYREQGIASWYGSKFHGRKTSNGEIYDLYAATAAHKTLPIPSYARVTNLENGRSVVVRINDRGPFHSDRIIDLSYGAAVKLGYMEQGTAPVEVAVIDVPGVDDRRELSGAHYRYIQMGAFSQRSAAEALRDKLRNQLAAPVELSPVQANGHLLFRVRVGPAADSRELQSWQNQLRDAGYAAGQLLP